MSTSVPNWNSRVMTATFSRQVVSMCFRPSREETASSMCFATSFSMSSGVAPTQVVVMVT